MEVSKSYCDVTTSISIQDGSDLVVNIMVFNLRIPVQRSTLRSALIKVNTFTCKWKISGFSSPLIVLPDGAPACTN